MTQYENRLLALFEEHRENYGRTYSFWADRWSELKRQDWIEKGKDMSVFKPIHPATIARWAKCDRRIGPNNRYIFNDPLVPFTMDEYYRETPPSDQTGSRSHVRFLGRTQAKKHLIEQRRNAHSSQEPPKITRTKKALARKRKKEREAKKVAVGGQ